MTLDNKRVRAYKAANGDMMIRAVAIPFGSPTDLDAHGEFFHADTDVMLDMFPKRMIIHAHGMNENGRVEEIGAEVKVEVVAGVGIVQEIKLEDTPKNRELFAASMDGFGAVSSAAISHLVRPRIGAKVDVWPWVETSVLDSRINPPANPKARVDVMRVKTAFKESGLEFPDTILQGDHARDDTDPIVSAGTLGNGDTEGTKTEGIVMDDNVQLDKEMVKEALSELLSERQTKADEQISNAEALKAQVADAAEELATEKTAELQKQVDELKEAAIKDNRLPFGSEDAPTTAKYADTWKYDQLSDGALGFAISAMNSTNAQRTDIQAKSGVIVPHKGATEAMVKALALRAMFSDERTEGRNRAKAAYYKQYGDRVALKADELNHTTQSGFGTEWVYTLPGTDLVTAIRHSSVISELTLPVEDIPQGFKSKTLQIEGADPTWYKVGETTDFDATTGRPNALTPSSKIGTTNKEMTVNKMGVRVGYSTEMTEDSIIRWAENAFRQIGLSASEVVEHAIIDGDTATGATTNINNIGGTPAGNEAFLMVDGFRKLALVTNTANSRAGGVLTVGDYLDTTRLIGEAGLDGMDQENVIFVIDANTQYKSRQLNEIVTLDQFSRPTLEGNIVTGLWGHKILTSARMQWLGNNGVDGFRLANTAGKIDLDTLANNTTGSILAIRKDRWRWGVKRALRTAVQNFVDADAAQIVGFTRFGLLAVDNEASAITYGITV